MLHKFHNNFTYIALEHFMQKSFEIAFEVFHTLQESEDFSVKEFIATVGQEELYESLITHEGIISSILMTKNYELIEEFFVWKYSVYESRGVNVDCFLVEYDLWKQSITNHLYQSHSSEINLMYEYLIKHHNHFKELSRSPKKVIINEKYKTIFDDLSVCLLDSDQEGFHTIIEKNLPLFDGDIFRFIEQVINPLMYDVGHKWQYNKLSVAKEHLATALTSEIIDTFFIQKNKSSLKKSRALISTVGDELHTLGVKIVGKFLDSCGYDVKNLGTKISSKELLSSVYELKPDLLLLSLTLPSNIITLQNIVSELKSDKVAFQGLIVVGGQALFSSEKPILVEGADLCTKDLNVLKNFLISAGQIEKLS